MVFWQKLLRWITASISFVLQKYIQKKKKSHQVLYKSDNFLVVDKLFDTKINSNRKSECTVQTFLRLKYPQYMNKKLVHEFYFVHRLDFATSGILCIPLHKVACKEASRAFALRNVKKYYVALLRGYFSKEFVDVDIPIGENDGESNSKKMCTSDLHYCVAPRVARSLFLVLQLGTFQNYPATKVLIRTVTGRRHQIRVHCSFLGHSVVGDYTYSNKKDTQPQRMFLHSLRLILPNSLEAIDVISDDPFTKTKIGNWVPGKSINDLSSDSFKKIDKCLKNTL